MASRTLDGSLAAAIISLLGEGADHEPDPEGTFLLGAQGDILIGLQHIVKQNDNTNNQERVALRKRCRTAALLSWDIVLPANAIEVRELSSAEILKLVDSAPWFSGVGRCGDRPACSGLVAEYLKRCGGAPVPEFRWIDDWDEAGRVARSLDAERALWKQEQAHRDRALEQVRALGRDARLQDSLHELSIIGYEKVRPAGYEKVRPPCYEEIRPEGYEKVRSEMEDEELARVAAGAGLWTASLSLVWATVGDVLAPEANPFLPKLEVFRMGNWPLGFEQGSFVVF